MVTTHDAIAQLEAPCPYLMDLFKCVHLGLPSPFHRAPHVYVAHTFIGKWAVDLRRKDFVTVMFSQACVKNSAHRWEGGVSQHALGGGGTPTGQTPPRQTPPGQTPPLPMATAADGTHPTGMHSSFI